MRDFDPTASEFISSGFLRHSRPDAPVPRHYLPAAVVTAMMVGAAVGAVTAAISGGNILKGALFGAIGGGIVSGIGAAFGAASGGAGGAAAGAAGDMAVGAAGAGAEGAAAGAAGSAPFEAGFVGTEALSGAGGTGLGAAEAAAGSAPATVGTGMEASIDYSLASGGGNGGTGLSMGDISSTAGSADTGLSAVAPAGGDGGGSFLDALLNKGKGMLNSRFVTGMAGNVLSGYSQGKMAEAKMAEQRRLLEDARANARFGNVGSRYGGMIYAPTTYK